MPITGIPDRERHGYCFRCHLWFEMNDGRRFEPPALTGFRSMRRTAERVILNRKPPYFICNRCWRIRRRRSRILLVLAAVAFGGAIMFVEMGLAGRN